MKSSESVRPWTVILDEVIAEANPRKLILLIRELNYAMQEQGVGTKTTQATRPRPRACRNTLTLECVPSARGF